MLSINQFPRQSLLPFWVLQEGPSEENQYNQPGEKDCLESQFYSELDLPGYEENYEQFAYMQDHSHLSLNTNYTNRMT